MTGNWSQIRDRYQIPYRLDNTPYMFVGADFFHAHRVFIDNKDRLMLFSYDGGPVFRANAAVAAATP